MNSNKEVVGLIETLHKADQRLEELTEGEVDSVMNRTGQTLLLRSAQDQLRHSESAKQAVIMQLGEANKDLETFSYSVSHDLRAPLRHIVGFVELLERDATPVLSVESLRYLKTISSSARRMGELIDDLLRFSRTGRADLEKVEIDLEKLITDVLSDYQAETARRSIVWMIHPMTVVWADYALLRMVLVNLISNAVKFTGPSAHPRIEVGYAPAHSAETVIFVRDNGTGFDQKQAGRLFGVFQRLHLESEFEGTGIGLANVQRIIHRHGGRAWAEGVVNGGATFYFSLPNEMHPRPSPTGIALTG